MAEPHATGEALKERASRALMGSPRPENLIRLSVGPSPGSHTEELQFRLLAIRLVRELEPKRACYAQRVRELSHSLVETSGDSVRYKVIMDRLREAHEEWLQVEEKLWAAAYMIRSTQWLVSFLADPTPGADG